MNTHKVKGVLPDYIESGREEIKQDGEAKSKYAWKRFSNVAMIWV